jgi:hypothetical protein
MKRIKNIVLLVVFLACAAWAYATSLKCSIDNFNLYFTGKTRTEMGKLLYEHKCATGHTYWLTSEQTNQ